MNCCINCFESNYLHQIILNNKCVGDCNYCMSQNVSIYDPSELNIFFRAILDLYEYEPESGDLIENQIIKDFTNKVFTNKVVFHNNIKQLICDIIKDDIIDYQQILEQHVKLKNNLAGVEEVIIKPLSLSWDKFSEEIKTVNRFHFVNNLDLEKLKSLFKHFEKSIPKGKKFYRARICTNTDGYPLNEMGNPPNNQARSGRANPEGISYLYLSSDRDTTLYETRASLFDYVCVGTFRLEENIRVVKLSHSTYDIFYLAEKESLEEVLIHSSFIDKLEKEISKPKRKSDSDLDYLPTQYLSELIKSMGYDGIEFQSSLYTNGYNIAIFNPEKFKCIETAVCEIENISLTATKIS